MSAFKTMVFFYGALMAVPLLLWIISMSYLLQAPYLPELRFVLGVLVGIGSIIFGVIGFREVFVHGK